MSKNQIELLSSGEIRIGSGNDVAVLGTVDADHRFWIGHTDPLQSVFRVRKNGQAFISGATISGTMQSSSFSQGISGWRLSDAGNAEFNDVTVRGQIKGAIFSKEATSVVAGRQIVTEGTMLLDNNKFETDPSIGIW